MQQFTIIFPIKTESNNIIIMFCSSFKWTNMKQHRCKAENKRLVNLTINPDTSQVFRWIYYWVLSVAPWESDNLFCRAPQAWRKTCTWRRPKARQHSWHQQLPRADQPVDCQRVPEVDWEHWEGVEGRKGGTSGEEDGEVGWEEDRSGDHPKPLPLLHFYLPFPLHLPFRRQSQSLGSAAPASSSHRLEVWRRDRGQKDGYGCCASCGNHHGRWSRQDWGRLELSCWRSWTRSSPCWRRRMKKTRSICQRPRWCLSQRGGRAWSVAGCWWSWRRVSWMGAGRSTHFHTAEPGRCGHMAEPWRTTEKLTKDSAMTGQQRRKRRLAHLRKDLWRAMTVIRLLFPVMSSVNSETVIKISATRPLMLNVWFFKFCQSWMRQRG